MDKLDSIIDGMANDIVRSVQEAIRLKSVKAEAKEGMPFGQDIDRCYKQVLRMAENLGYTVKDLDSWAGHAETGAGQTIIGILCHLDVVPEGNDWEHEPFGGEVCGGRIYGRGAIDDKGPLIACMYAVRAVKMAGIKLDKRIRIIFGLDEESSWDSIKYYFEHEQEPDFGFTPDSVFPVICGEKGISTIEICCDLEENEEGDIGLLSLSGGVRDNMVPDFCKAVIVCPALTRNLIDEYVQKTGANIEIEVDGNMFTIMSYGVSAHGSTPEKGVNAVSQLMGLLDTLNLKGKKLRDFIHFYCANFINDYYGLSLGCGCEDSISGKLTVNIGKIEYDYAKSIQLTANIRYPIKQDINCIYSRIKNSLTKYGCTMKEKSHKKPIYKPIDNKLIQALLKAYRDVSCDYQSEPLTICGGTYARAMKNAVAFGPLMPGRDEVGHQKNEYISVEDLLISTKIYAHAVEELLKL